MTFEFDDALRLARELTGSQDIDALITAAVKLMAFEATTQDDNFNVSDAAWIDPKPLGLADFMATTKVWHPIRGEADFKPYIWQRHAAEYIEAYDTTLIASARQVGSTALLVRTALHAALSIPDATIMMIAPNFSQVRDYPLMMRAAGDFGQMDRKTDHVSNFSNGSRIMWQSAKSATNAARGNHLDMVLFDNADFISHSAVEDLWASIVQRLASHDSKIIITGQNYRDPKNLLGSLWQSDGPAARICTPYQNISRCRPSITDDVKTMKSVLSPEQFRKEYLCDFPVASALPSYREEWDATQRPNRPKNR